MDGAAWVSRLLGWTYTVAWSLSFYPQLILNYQRKSSTGLSSDFVAINPTGHGALLIVNVALYSSAVVRGQYEARHGGHPPQVRLNDVWFSSHATLLATLILLQSFYYKRDPSQRVSSFNRVFLVCVTAASILLALIAASPSFPRFEYLDVIQFLSYVKLYISFSKYVPQVKLNFVRKSTVGWSIENIILDLTGGILSLMQLVLDSWAAQDWTGITGNPAKLGLSLLTLGFDAIFIVQHYVLYRASTTTLLDPGSTTDSSTNRTSRSDEEQARQDGIVADDRSRDGLVFERGQERRAQHETRRNVGERQPLLDPTTPR
ncbi:hypothetical protein JCM3766R1_001683 [Sporobolomyces carnicolor]